MVKAVKPGGLVLIWVYGRENNEWIVKLVSPLRRMLLSRLPIRALHLMSVVPSTVLWLWLRARRPTIEYERFLRRCSFRHLRSIVFDQMLPRIAHYWPRNVVEEMLGDAGLRDVRLEAVNEVSWSAIGRKPIGGNGVSA